MSCENGSTVSARKKRSRTPLIASTWTPRLLRLIRGQVVQIVALMLDQRSEANSIAPWSRRRLRNAWRSDSPSCRQITALPSIRSDDALRRLVASTIVGKRSASINRPCVTAHPRLPTHHHPVAVLLEVANHEVLPAVL